MVFDRISFIFSAVYDSFKVYVFENGLCVNNKKGESLKAMTSCTCVLHVKSTVFHHRLMAWQQNIGFRIHVKGDRFNNLYAENSK